MEGDAAKRFKRSEDFELGLEAEPGPSTMAAIPSTSAEALLSQRMEVPEEAQSTSNNALKVNGNDRPPDDSNNPMEHSKILNNVFQYLERDYLKTLRLVNKDWEVVATKILQEELDPIAFTDEFYDVDKMLKVVQTCKNSVNPPYVKFEIASRFFTVGNEDLITDFFRVCAPIMESVTICIDRNRDSKFKFAEVLLTTVTFPKLKSLIFEDHTPNGIQAQFNHDFSLFFKALLNAATSLERLDLSFPKRFFDSDDSGAMAQLHQIPDGIICSRSSQNLKHLEISAKITDSQLLCLAKAGLKLKTLHFRVKNVTLLENSFTALLESQSDTLEELKLTEERHGSDLTVKFPTMKKLKKITIISICEFENSIVRVAPFDYQEHLPQVEALNFWNCFGKEERWCQFFLATSPSLTILKLELPTQFRNPAMAPNIAVMFPVLKRLKIGFSLRPENEDTLKIIFETMVNLEELDIRTDMDEMNENIDHVLTGLPKALCKQLRQNRQYLSPSCLEGVDRGPSLVSLKNLKRLDIILDNNRAPFITDVSGHLAFMEMPKLQILRFTRYGMSQECVDQLLKKYRVGFIPRHGRNFFECENLSLEDFD